MRITAVINLVFYLVLNMNYTFGMDPYENLLFEHLTINDGLSQNFVERILQDKQGFIWLATKDGLNRYDGNEWRIYRHDPDLPNSITGNEIKDMLESKNGDLWIIADQVNLYNRNEDNFTYVSINTNSDSPAEAITDICEDHSGNIWIAANGQGLYQIRIKKPSKYLSNNDNGSDAEKIFEVIGPYQLNPNKKGIDDFGRFLDIYVDSHNRLWVATQSGLDRLSANSSGEFPDPEDAVFQHIETGLGLTSEPQISIHEDGKSNIWIGTHLGLLKYSYQKNNTDRVHFFSYPKNFFNETWEGSVSDIEEDDHGIFWIATFDGLLFFNPDEPVYDKIVNLPGNEASIGFNNIRCIYRDNGNLMWVGTAGMGVDKIKVNYKSFKHYLGKSYDGTVFSTYSIVQDKSGKLWFTNNHGRIYQFEPASNNLVQFNPTPGIPTTTTDMVSDKQGDIYFVTGNYLYKHISTSGNLDNFKLSEGKHIFNPSDSIPIIHIDRDDQVWLCNTNNLFRINVENTEIKRFKLLFKNLKKVNALFRDQDGIFWIGTMKGLIRYDIINNHQDLYSSAKNSKVLLPLDQINDIEPSPVSDLLWIATGGGGILSLNRTTLKLNQFTARDGLANNYVYSILTDEEDLLWLSTNHGLSKFDPANNKFTNYTVEDGLQSNEFNSYSKYKSASGELFFGGINGITAFYPNQISYNPHEPQIVITDFALFNKSVNQYQPGSPLDSAINVTDKIELSYNQNNLSFHFAALDFIEPNNNQYKYILRNFDDDWIEAGTNRSASYTNLHPGEYIFEVKGSNNDGIWNPQARQLQLIIYPPFWRTWWAYTIYSLIFILAVYAVYKSQKARIVLREQLKYEKLESQKLAELDELKSHFFTGISHEFRTPLSLILGKIEDWISESDQEAVRDKLNSLKKHSSELMQLVNQLLDLARVESGDWKLNYQYLDIVEVVKGIISQFDHTAIQKAIVLEFTSDLDELKMDLEQSTLQKILQNLISNAIKFSLPNKKIIIRIKYPVENSLNENANISVKAIQIDVIDQGKGISKEHLLKVFDRFYQVKQDLNHNPSGFGVGLWFSKALVKKLNGKIFVKSELTQGSTFSIQLPVYHNLKKENYQTLAPAIENKGDVLHEKMMSGSIKESKSFPSIEGITEGVKNENLILIVEDHPELNTFLCNIIGREYSIIEAKNGQEGLDLAISRIPDIILSDIMMPELDGFAMATRLKNDLRTNHIPLLFLTAKAADKDKLKALELGINDYILKPFSPEELLLRIRNLLTLRDNIKYNQLNEGISNTDNIQEPEFITMIRQIISDNIENEQFGVDYLCRELGMSRTQLFRKLKATSHLSAVQMIQNSKLQVAMNLLKNGHRVSEAAYKVGYNSLSHFSKLFKEKFGHSPKEYAQK